MRSVPRRLRLASTARRTWRRFAPRALTSVPGRVEALGGDHQVVAAAADQLAQHLLGLAVVVLVGGIEEVDAGIARGAEHATRFGGVGVAAEGHRAEAKLGHLHAAAAEDAIFHPGSLP